MEFVAVDNVKGHFGANGVLGLGPDKHGESFIHQLYAQQEIDELKVGFNYEDPKDKAAISTVNFGYFDYEEVKYGQRGLYYFPNSADNSDYWAVSMIDLTYGEVDLNLKGNKKLALIDSANSTI